MIIFKRMLCLMLGAALLVCAAGCGDQSSVETTQTSQAAQTEAQTEVKKPELETEVEIFTEPETEAAYNEDGSRRAWIASEGRLNVRSKASKKGEFIGVFSPRQEIKVLDETPKKGFLKVSGTDYLYGQEITGYASADYITYKAPDPPQVTLDVVSYLQTDERWADMLLGSTSKNMYDYGCATSALAMCESYLKHKEITPEMICEDSYYTGTGEIEWPKDYYWNYNKSGYLEFIYNRLHEGIPVLLGGTKTNGRPHWILIVGYTGDGENLNTRDFLINDPLPSERTTLAEYLETYPVFSKLIYYVGDRALVEGSEEWKALHEESTQETTKKSAKKSGSKKSSKKK